jgi:class 3 adenylate cyclase
LIGENMGLGDELRKEVKDIFKSPWKTRDGDKIPETDDIALGNEAVKLDGTVLYADLADSTDMVNQYKAEFCAEVYKTYLISVCRIIRSNGGSITAFDGDRVMAVFMGDIKSTTAAKTALQINWAVNNIINDEIKKQYPTTTFKVKQSVGIDTSSLFIARTGIRGSNDLVWVGRSANYAAKLSAYDNSYPSWITESVFNLLLDSSKYGGDPKKLMWEKVFWAERSIYIYRSSWSWAI